jgi:hypothetical protein
LLPQPSFAHALQTHASHIAHPARKCSPSHRLSCQPQPQARLLPPAPTIVALAPLLALLSKRPALPPHLMCLLQQQHQLRQHQLLLHQLRRHRWLLHQPRPLLNSLSGRTVLYCTNCI